MLRTVAVLMMTALAVAGTTPAVSGTEPTKPTVVTFTFDDGWANQLQAADVLNRHNMTGTFYIMSGSLGLGDYLAPSQVQRLVDKGHEIAGHTQSHDILTEFPAAKVKQEVCGDRAALAKLGFPVKNFAYPFGADSPAVAQIVRDCGYNSARDVGGLSDGPNDCSSCPVAEDLPPTDHQWNIRTHTTARQGAAGLAAIKGYVTHAESTGGWVPLVFHRICAACDGESMSIEHFTEFVEWLAARPSTTTVQTVEQVVGGGLQPLVGEPDAGGTAPPPGPAPSDQGRALNTAVAFSVGGVGIGQIQVVVFTLMIALGLITWYRLKTRSQRHEGWKP